MSTFFLLCSFQFQFTDWLQNEPDNSSKSVGILRTVFLLFWSFAISYMYCDLGEMITTQFDAFNAELGQREWYLFPCEIQRLFIVVIANAQHSTYIQGYGQILCLRETMKKVRVKLWNREIYSFHMVCPAFSDSESKFLLLYDATQIVLNQKIIMHLFLCGYVRPLGHLCARCSVFVWKPNLWTSTWGKRDEQSWKRVHSMQMDQNRNKRSAIVSTILSFDIIGLTFLLATHDMCWTLQVEHLNIKSWAHLTLVLFQFMTAHMHLARHIAFTRQFEN